MHLPCEEMKAELGRRLRQHRAEYGIVLDVSEAAEMGLEWHEDRLTFKVAWVSGPTWRIPFDEAAEAIVRAGMQKASGPH